MTATHPLPAAPGRPVVTIVDRAAEFVPAVERVFGVRPRVLGFDVVPERLR